MKVYEEERRNVPSEVLDRVHFGPMENRQQYLTELRVHLACYQPFLQALDLDVNSIMEEIVCEQARRDRMLGAAELPDVIESVCSQYTEHPESYGFQRCVNSSRCCRGIESRVDALECDALFPDAMAQGFFQGALAGELSSEGISAFHQQFRLAMYDYPEQMISLYRGLPALYQQTFAQMGQEVSASGTRLFKEHAVDLGAVTEQLVEKELCDCYQRAGVVFDYSAWTQTCEKQMQESRPDPKDSTLSLSDVGLSPFLERMYLSQRLLSDANRDVFVEKENYEEHVSIGIDQICGRYERRMEQLNVEQPGTRFVIRRVGQTPEMKAQGLAALNLAFANDSCTTVQAQVPDSCVSIAGASGVSHYQVYAKDQVDKILSQCDIPGKGGVFRADYYLKGGQVMVDANTVCRDQAPFNSVQHERITRHASEVRGLQSLQQGVERLHQEETQERISEVSDECSFV